MVNCAKRSRQTPSSYSDEESSFETSEIIITFVIRFLIRAAISL